MHYIPPLPDTLIIIFFLFFFDFQLQIMKLEAKYLGMVKKFHKQLGAVLKEIGITRAGENTFNMKFLDETLLYKVAEAKAQMTMSQKQCCELVESHIRAAMVDSCIFWFIFYL